MDLKILINESEIIESIYLWYLSRKSMCEIVKMLNSNKITTKKGGFMGEKDCFYVIEKFDHRD